MANAEEQVPRVRLAQGQEVSLGCGTLIIIALIVIFFAGDDNKDLERELRTLRNEVVELRTSIESLEEAIERDQRRPLADLAEEE